MLPILLNHDATQPIGMAEMEDSHLSIRFREGHEPPLDGMFSIFGSGVGFQVLETVERGGVQRVRHARILEFSLTPETAMRAL